MNLRELELSFKMNGLDEKEEDYSSYRELELMEMKQGDNRTGK
ncbi:MAG: hypothetical protein ACLTBV_13795 [Enterocloster bolteae]